MAIRRDSIDHLLVKKGVAPAIVAEAQAQALKIGGDLLSGILKSEVIEDRHLVSALSETTGIPILHEIPVDDLDPTLVRNISMGLAREQSFLPLWIKGGVLHVGISNPRALANADDLRVLHKMPVQTWLVAPGKLREIQHLAYDKAARTASAVMEEIREETQQDEVGDLNLDADLVDDPNQAPIIRFVNSLMTQAIKDRASDIHIEPFEKELSVRFRIDGVLYEIVKPPARLQASIVARVKIMAQLNIAEKRIPQDGRIRTRMAGREIDIRVSTLPVRHGERVVMRLLEKGTVFNLEQVGMGPLDMAHFRKLIQLPHGIILVCGPTGSGKTTTLYSALSEINAPDLNILTIEDPIEYELKGIGQTQVNPKIDLTFASALRAHLRQDPDVILVGEIRDKETADNAVQASLTGHLVFSTIHTNDAPTTFTRLTDMGVEPFLVASSLIAVLAQRLVRRLCNECKQPYQPSDAELSDVGLDREKIRGTQLYRATGCKECLNKGYRGRTGIYELLLIDDDVRALVTANANSNIIKRKAVENGMRTLREDGIRKALEGVTSIDEVMRVTQEDVVELD
jgi:general secretion pathway protein E